MTRTIDTTIMFLNEILTLDPEAISQIVFHRVSCNETLANHPTVQTGDYHLDIGPCTLGTLGLLNGLFGNGERIAAVVDENDLTRVIRFEKLDIAD